MSAVRHANFKDRLVEGQVGSLSGVVDQIQPLDCDAPYQSLTCAISSLRSLNPDSANRESVGNREGAVFNKRAENVQCS